MANENGKMKRVLFDGGYATFGDTGVPSWHYFLCDHAGSVRVVTDMWGRPEQINHYYPFGLPFADAGKGADLQPYKFGGKELDAMYGHPIRRIDPSNSRWRSEATPPECGLYNFDF